MARRNGKSEVEITEFDGERELPPSSDALDETGPLEGSADGNTAANQSELEKVTAERDTLLDRLARAQAEFDNARKRAAKEQQEYRDYAQADAIKALLPVIDSFERALRDGDSSQNPEFRNGVDLIYKQLHDVLLKLGLRPIPAKGQPFDPHLHEAIELVDSNEAADQTVIDELQRGYKLKERLLRPAMVKVARNPRQ